jgi:hypothetical protein
VAAGTPATEPGITLDIQDGKAWLDGQGPLGAAALDRQLRRRTELFRALNPGSMAGPVYVRLARATRLGDAISFLRTAAARGSMRLVVVHPPKHPDPHTAHPVPRWVQQRMAASAGGEEDAIARATTIAACTQDAITTCAPVIRLYGQLAAMTMERRQTALSERLPQAIRDCDCGGVDVDALEALVHWAMDADGPDQRWLPLTLGRLRQFQRSAPANASARDLARALAAS